MADKTIMLACSAGMSTSLLVSKMQNAAKEKGKDYKIFATAASGIQDEIDKERPRYIDAWASSSIHGRQC